MGHVTVVAHGAEMLVSWLGSSYIDGASLRDKVCEATGYSKSIVQLHYCSSNPDTASMSTVTGDDTLLQSGSRVHLVLPVMFRARVEKRGKAGVRRHGIERERARRPRLNAFCPAGYTEEGVRVIERMRELAQGHGWDFVALARAVTLVRHCALRRRAAKDRAAPVIQAVLRREASARSWIRVNSAWSLQASVRRAAARLHWVRAVSGRALQASARRALRNRQFGNSQAARLLQAHTRTSACQARHRHGQAARFLQAHARTSACQERHRAVTSAGLTLVHSCRRALGRSAFIKVRRAARTSSAELLQGACRRVLASCRAIAVLSVAGVRLQAVARGALRTRGLAGMRVGALTLQRLSRTAICPSFDAFRAVHHAVEEAGRGRVDGVAVGKALLRSLEGFAQAVSSACGPVGEFAEGVKRLGELLDALAESEAGLESHQQAVRECVRACSDDWQSHVDARDKKRAECLECGRRVVRKVGELRAQQDECDAAQARVVAAFDEGDLAALFGYQAFDASGSDVGSSRVVALDGSECTRLVANWKVKQGGRQRELENATRDSDLGLWSVVGGAQRGLLGALQDALDSAVNESSWFEFGCAAECQKACEPLVSSVHGLLKVLGTARSSLEACDTELSRLDVQLPEWDRASSPLYLQVHQTLEELRVSLAEIDDDDRYEAAESRVNKLTKKQKKGQALTEQEEEKLREAKEVMQEKKRSAQALHRQQRAMFAELAVLASSHFPEIPLLFPGQPLIQDLFQHDVARLFVPGRSLEDYTVSKTLSVTPKSRHNVFQAELDEESCALKEYNLDSDFSVKTLQQELAILSGLDHPCILKINCFFLDEAKAYVELPLCNEGNVEEWVAKTNPHPSSIHVALHQILRAVEYLHARDIVHCDIRSANVLVQTDEQGLCQAFLSDFDISISLKRICTRASTMSSTGMRGFDGQLSMAPEVRAGRSCSTSSDMFSFGGLAFMLVLRDYCLSHGSDSLPPGDGTAVAIPTFEDEECRHLLSLLLCVEPEARFSAAYAMAHPYFASGGALARQQAREQVEELVRKAKELEEERSAAHLRFQQEEGRVLGIKAELEAKIRDNDQQRRKLEKREEAVKERLERDKRELEQQRADLEKRRRQDAEVRRRKEKEAREKLKEIEAKKAEALQKQKELQRDNLLPHFWSISSDPPGGFKIVPIGDEKLLASLQKFLNSDRVGGGGRDQTHPGRYSRLSLERAWRIENPVAWRSYTAARKRVMSVRSQGPKFPRLDADTDAASRELPGGADPEINEKRLLHGTKAEHILSLARNGFNERFAGSSAGTAFGDGSYFAEDAAKSDQYVVPHRQGQCPDLSRKLYSRELPHPDGEVFYIFVCKVVLGFWLRVENPSQLGRVFHPQSRRELKAIEGISPPTPHHSVHVRLPNHFQEFVVFHGDQVFAEYILAFTRKQ